MLDFINNNGVLFSGIFSIGGVLITVIVTLIIENKKSKIESVKTLKKELVSTKQELEKCKAAISEYERVKNDESNIDKRKGGIYTETLSNGTTRDICGFCWEKDHVKLPLVVDTCYDECEKQSYYDGYCQSCKSHCRENINPTTHTKVIGDTTSFVTPI